MPERFEIYAVRSQRESPVRALLPEEGTARFDPFLVVHEQGPITYPPQRAIGFPEHPHRGIETITYVVRGEQFHCDSFGHHGELRAGDLQWMSAAAGIIHSELPTERLFEAGGEVHAFQIWLNLPRARKMEAPRYQDVRAADIPTIAHAGGRTRLLAGAIGTHRSPVDCGRPVLMLHSELELGADWSVALPPGSTVVVYAISGDVALDGEALGAAHLAVGRTRDALALSASRDAELLILAAQPLGEPVVSRGPFVMTSDAEIELAYRDLIDGRFGHSARLR